MTSLSLPPPQRGFVLADRTGASGADPDISALAVSGNVMNGEWGLSGGTSSSSPFFAGLVALLNAARLEAGQPPMGFINPWLYKMAAEHPESVFDVTEGNNFCDGSDKDDGNRIGFVASEGWDPVTGLGTMNMEALVALATAA